MLSDKVKPYILAFLGAGLFYTSIAHADFPTLDKVLETFSNNVPELMRLVTAFAYLMGLSLIVKAIFALKQFAEQRTMMSSSHSLKGPMIYLGVGSLMIYLPSAIQMGLDTLWLSPAPFAYVVEEGNPWSQMIKAAFMVLQLIGVIAFIRGLIIMSHLGGQGGQPGTFGKAMTHIIGGILCINMYDTVRTILNSFGLSDIFS